MPSPPPQKNPKYYCSGALNAFPLPDPRQVEKEVMTLIEMSREALSHLRLESEPGERNMAKWLGWEAIEHSKSLEGRVQAEAFSYYAYCCWAHTDFFEAVRWMEEAKRAKGDAWTSSDEIILTRYKKLAGCA